MFVGLLLLYVCVQNVLKIHIAYVGWSERWNEWIQANSKRILVRHKDHKATAADAATAAFNSRRRNGARGSKQRRSVAAVSGGVAIPARCPFNVSGRTGILVKVDIGNGGNPEDDAMGLVRATDPYTGLTVYLWLKLSLLRPIPTAPLTSSPPLFGVTNSTAGAVLPYPLTAYPYFHTAAFSLPFDELMSTGADIESRAVTSQAHTILQFWIRRLLAGSYSPSAAAAAAAPLLMRSPSTTTDDKSSVGGSAIRSIGLPSALIHLPIADLISVLPSVCGDVVTSTPSMLQHSFPSVSLASPNSSYVVSSQSATSNASFNPSADRSQLITHLSNHLLSQLLAPSAVTATTVATPTSPPSPSPLSPTRGTPTIPNAITEKTCRDLYAAIKSCESGVQNLLSSLKLATATIVKVLAEEPELTKLSTAAEDVEVLSISLLPTPMDVQTLQNLPLVCRFYADPRHTVLLREFEIGECNSIQPFAVPNPCYVGLLNRSKLKLSSKDAPTPATFLSLSVTPLTARSFESWMAVIDLVCALRSSVDPRRTDLCKQLNLLLTRCWDSAGSVLVQSHAVLRGVPCNIRLRIYETLTRLLVAMRGAVVQHSSLIVPRVCEAAFPAVSWLGSSVQSDPELKSSSGSWIIDLLLPEAKHRFASEKHKLQTTGQLYSVYMQRLFELLMTAVLFEDAVNVATAMANGTASVAKQEVNNKLLPRRILDRKTAANGGDSKTASGSGGRSSAAADEWVGHPNPLTGPVREPTPIDTLAPIARGQLRIVCEKQLPVMSALSTLISESVSATLNGTGFGSARAPRDWDVGNCVCKWCTELVQTREQRVMAMQLIDLSSASSIWSVLLDQLTAVPAGSGGSNDSSTAAFAAVTVSADSKSDRAAASTSSAPAESELIPLAARLLPNQVTRITVFEYILNTTATQNRQRPEM